MEAQTSRAAGSPFVAVFIDDQTEQELGPFPCDRAVLARGVDRAADLGARAVVLKFFIDKPRSPDGDQSLIRAMARIKTIPEARIENSEPAPNELPSRFVLDAAGAPFGDPLSGTGGWIPLPELSAAAYDVGFSDYRVADQLPIVEQYRGHLVKSLWLCCLEMATGKRATVVPGKSISLNGVTLPMTSRSEIIQKRMICRTFSCTSFFARDHGRRSVIAS